MHLTQGTVPATTPPSSLNRNNSMEPPPRPVGLVGIKQG